MLIDAAIDGQGIALARTALAALDLIHGRLVKPVDVSLGMLNTYWIVSPKTIARTPKIATFRQLIASFAYDEGEDDRSLASWREGHRRHFTRRNQFSQDMMLYSKRFRIVQRL